MIGFVYKLLCTDEEFKEIYVGSTKDPKERGYKHKSRSIYDELNKNCKAPLYDYIRRSGGFDKWKMEILEAHLEITKPDLLARERHWKETLGANLNVLAPIRTAEEQATLNRETGRAYYLANRNEIAAKHKEYRDAHLEEEAARHKAYREENAEQLSRYFKRHYEENKDRILAQHKEYRDAHKEQDRATQKAWREANKERIRARKSERIMCECGKTYARDSKSSHMKTHRPIIPSQASDVS